MTDEANAPSSNEGVSEIVQPDVQTSNAPALEPPQDSKPAASSREALERAFASVTDQPKPESKDRGDGRNDRGQFAPKAGDEAKPANVKPPEAPKLDAQPLEAPKPDAPKPVTGNAPPGFTKAAAEAWGQTPDAVRADVERRLTELTQGIEGYKQQIEPIRKYVDMAQQHGTTLDRALENYVGMEQLLTRDFVGGVRLLCQNMGFHPAQLVAALTGQQVNGAHGQQSPEVAQLRQTNQALEQKIAKLEEKFGGFETNFQDRQVADMIADFKSKPEHKYFDELRESIGQMLATGFAKDLSDAYDKAARLNPEVFAKVEADKAAQAAKLQTPTPDPAQTRKKAALSVTGSPPVGSNPSARKPAGSTREALVNAMAQVGL
jgi:hypothetical protein